MTFSQVLTLACPVRQEVFDLVREHPGITMQSLCQLLPHRDRQEVVSAVYSLNGILIHPCVKVYRDSGRGRVNGWGVLR